MKRQTSRWTEKHAFDVHKGLENHVLAEIFIPAHALQNLSNEETRRIILYYWCEK